MSDSRTNWLLLINAGLGSFLAGTASRIFAVSLPTVARSLDTTIVGISWAVISFQISTISLSLVFGRIGDIYGRERIFGLGFLVSAIGASLCALSQNVFQLIAFRFFQGIGASMTQSQARALAMDSMPKESAGKAQGFMTTAFHSGVLVGPSVGGLIIDYVHWRAIFFFLLPIALAGMTLTWLNLKRVNKTVALKPATAQTAIDYLGAALLVLATIALIVIIDHRIMEIVGGKLWIGIIVVFAALLLGFLWREWTATSPILDLSLFRIRMFTLSGLSLLLVGVAQVMVGFVLPFYLQDILHLSPSFMGLLFISAPVFTVTLSPIAGWAADKVGPRLPSTMGILFLVGAAFIGGFLRADSNWTSAVIVLALWGLATALFYPPNHAAMIGSVPAEHRGVATGAVYVMFGLGSTFGISLGTLLLTAAFRYYSADPSATPTAANPAVFVSAMNFTFFAAGIMGLVAMTCSAMRGTQKKTI
ncbi:MAG TPA: MFS transporter [Candidatus Binatia bacterium]|jgi:EmrB/QacA subfamily drug resistance transporter